MADSKKGDAGPADARELGNQALLAGFCAFEQAAQTHSDLTYRTDGMDRLEWLSKSGARALGYDDAAGLLGRTAGEALYRAVRERDPLLESLTASQGPVCLEELLRRADGSTMAVRTRAIRRSGANGGMEAHVLILSGEIEARLILAKALREMETIFDNALVGVLLARNHRCEKINARGAELLGRTAGELYGATAESLFPSPESHALFLKTAYEDLCANGRHIGEYTLRRSDGSPLVLRAAARMISPCDAAEGVIWAFDDVTEQKRLEQELLASKRAAETANTAKTQFLANISHELRTPLNGILGMSQLLLDKETDDEAREYLGIIKQSASTLVHIVGDLLDLSNVESGRIRLTEREFDLKDELTPLLRNFAAQSLLRSFEFTYVFDPLLPTRVVGDANRAKQILINLLSNAFKYTKKGHVAVRIGLDKPGLDRQPADQGTGNTSTRVRLLLAVEDTGVGIDPGATATIFEPFGIGENYLTKKYSGAGLGLAIARKLATMLGGDITFSSNPGQGSTFYATLECGLPAAERPPRLHPRPPLAVPAAPAAQAAPPGGGLRILLAEDEPVNRIFTVRALQKLGHTVDSAADGREALVMLGRAAYDLVLMDIQMPRLNGLEATRLIRSGQVQGLAPTIPVVALTAYAMDSDREKGREAGMDEYVTKPFEPAELVAAMARAMAK
ncbi:PAS domain-containing sensor histidine kinase [Desulfovibrio sp. TomC]|uniref:PAS domain-containing sensor histidine kinase n=1 Tax=Desulfovibrio sp. TomC TaxID=1562888 RepID=UPI000575DBB7|nr:PAS domain-containing sensor histidine kinase [Desulfovibrio sp. TomC]KHK00403.1 multi-sensor hybrid histidine kinase [Desulfovibrio sp. TomC]